MNSKEEQFKLDISSVLDLYQVEELIGKIKYNDKWPTELDMQNLERITTPGIQLLIAMTLTAQQRGTALEWDMAHPVIAEAFQLMGMTSELFTTREQSHE